MAWKKVGKLTTPSTLVAGKGLSLSVKERVRASVPSLPISKCARLTEPSSV